MARTTGKPPDIRSATGGGYAEVGCVLYSQELASSLKLCNHEKQDMDNNIHILMIICDQNCSQFQAADVIRSKSRTANLAVTGVFGSACKHEIPHKFLNIRKGER